MIDRINDLNIQQMSSKRPVIEKSLVHYEWQDSGLLDSLIEGVGRFWPYRTEKQNEGSEDAAVRMANRIAGMVGWGCDLGPGTVADLISAMTDQGVDFEWTDLLRQTIFPFDIYKAAQGEISLSYCDRFMEEPACNLILLQDDAFRRLTSMGQLTFFAFSERFREGTGYVNECDRHWEFGPGGSQLRHFTNEGCGYENLHENTHCDGCYFSDEEKRRRAKGVDVSIMDSLAIFT